MLLIMIPLTGTLTGTWPMRFSDVAWRYGAVGLYSRALVIPMLGLFLTLLVAAAFNHRRFVRAVSVLAGITGIAVVCIVILFSLDIIQLRSSIRPEMKDSFDVANIGAFLRYSATLVFLGMVARKGWKASGHPASVPKPLSEVSLILPTHKRNSEVRISQ